MVLSWIWGILMLASVLYGAATGSLSGIGSAALEGAGGAVELCVGIAGVTCFWCGLIEIMERSGLLRALTRLLSPLIGRLFPSSLKNPELAKALSSNMAANLLGLGNAATPQGLRAVSLMERDGGHASDEMCRLVVLNTASIQLIPTTVAAVRAAAGSSAPLDILPAVWATSVCSVAAGLLAAAALKKLWRS